MHASPQNNTLTLKLTVKNHSKTNTVYVGYLNAAMLIGPERYAMPETTRQFKKTINPGEKEKYILLYQPVNHQEIFNKTRYRGDLKQTYKLGLGFIGNNISQQANQDTLYFSVPEADYTNYLYNYGQDINYNLYEMAHCNNFIVDQQKHLKYIDLFCDNANPENPSLPENIVLASGSDIILNNKVLKLSGYHTGKTLILDIGVVNMGTGNLKADLKKLGIHANGICIKPKAIDSEFFTYNTAYDSTYILNPGARFFFQMTFPADKAFDEFELDTSWLFALCRGEAHSNNNYHRLLKNNLIFKKES